jgi:putative ABC transport system permease protein
MERVVADVRHAVRSLARQPGLALAALLTLAVGIGAATAIFSITYGVLLRPLPYDEPDRLVRVSERHPGAEGPLRGNYLTNFTWAAWREPRTLEALAAYSRWTHTVRVGDDTTRLDGSSVSPALFRILRVRPALGRFFLDEEARPDRRVAVISHGFWQSRFGGAPGAVGASLMIDGKAHTIVGVAPADFAFPSADAQLWTPFVMAEPGRERTARVSVFFALARLRPRATPEQASAEGTAAARSQPRPITAELMLGKGGVVEVTAQPIVDEIVEGIRPALLVLLAGGLLVLAIACGNVAQMLLSRGIDRRRELAVRVALGATAGRIARHVLAESLLLATAGGLAGLLLGWLIVRLVPVLAPEDFPRLDAIRMDAGSVAIAIVGALASGLLAGLLPAWRGWRAALSGGLREDDVRTSTTGRTGRRALLAGEAALAVILLVGAALLGRGFAALTARPNGYDPRQVLTARVHVTSPPPPPAAVHSMIDEILSRLRASPHVQYAAAGNMAPFADSSYLTGFGLPNPNGNGERILARALAYVVTPDYVPALGMTLREGRTHTAADATSPGEALIVNETFARLYLKDGRPITGRRYPGLMGNDNTRMFEIVGVLADVRRHGPLSRPEAEIYAVEREKNSITREIYLAIRTTGDPLALAPDLRSIVATVAPTAAIDHVETLDDRLSSAVSEPRFVLVALTVFAAVALALAAIGLYGALSYAVSQRRRELGVRAALGASARNLTGLVLAQGLGTTIAGLAVGLIAAALLSRLLTRMLYGVPPLDVLSFTLAPLVLIAIATLACVLPARRAAAADPAEALRSE